jgi:gliding motility-associated-like protein
MKFSIQIQRAFLIRAFLFVMTLLGVARVSAQVPTISSFSPASAAAGASVTITGTNFDATIANNQVVICGVKAAITAASATSLTITVPVGIMGNGTISVLNKVTGLWVISTKMFQTVFSPNKTQLLGGDIPLQGTISSQTLNGLYGIEAGDFDGDGKLDIVASNSDNTNSSVFVRLNNSTTTNIAFGNSITVTVSGITNVGYQFAVADFDGDGKQDIAVPGIASNSVAILQNTSSGIGAISFTTTVESSGLTATGGVAAADFDGDGKIDMASVGSPSGGLVVSTNTTTSPGAAISFNPTRLVFSTIFNAFFLSVADFDADGKPDIITANSAANTIYILRNTTTTAGSPSFTLSSFSNTFFSNPQDMGIGDIDGDGKPDVIVTDAHSTTATSFVALRNTSSGIGSISFSQSSFSTSSPASSNFGQYAPSLADINGDGKLDIVVSLNYSAAIPADRVERIAVFNNTSSVGTISFSSPFVAQSTGGSFNNIHGRVLAGDFSGDGRPDIVAALNSHARIAIFRNELVTSGPPTISSLSASSGVPGSTSIGISGSNFNSTATNNLVFFGPVRATPTAISGTTQLTVTVPDNAAYGPVTVLNAQGTLSSIPTALFRPAFAPNKASLATTDFVSQTAITSTGVLYGLAAADLDNDGKTDIIETNSNSNSVILRKNVSTSGGPIIFNPGIIFNLFTALSLEDTRYPAAGDLDGDGLPDIVVPIASSNKVAVMGINVPGANVFSNSMTVTGSFDAGSTPNSVAIGDLDGDGKPEIVTGSHSSSSISILRNKSVNLYQPSFDAPLSISVGSHLPFYVALTDLNGDGKLDIVTENSTSALNGSRLILMTNISTPGTLSFTTTEVATPKNQLWYLATGDIDGDGKPDIIGSQGAFGPVGYALTIWRNTSTISTTSVGSPVTITMTHEQKSIGLADYNGDGKVDILTNITGSSGVSVLPNASTVGNIVFSSAITLTTSVQPHAVLATDLNGDDKPDIVSGNQVGGNGTLNFYMNSLIAPPVNQSTNIVVSAITGTSANFSWTTGTGTGNKRALFIKQDNTGTAVPVAGTDYTANTVFGTGSQIGSTGWYCVFNGTGNSVAVTGLSPSTNYRAMVTAYNDADLTNVAQYNINTATNNPVTLTTRATITAISRTTASATINTGTADFSVTFNAAVTGLTPTNFSLTTSGVSGASVTAVAGSGTTFTVTTNTGTGDGTIRLNLQNTSGMSAGVTNTLPFNGETYTIDKTPPTLSPVTIVSNNSNTAKAKAGDIITLAFSSSETITTPTVTVSGNTASVTNTSGNNWTASYTMTGSDAEGAVAFNIAFSDLVGNAGSPVTATTNSSSVLYDKTIPTLTSVVIASNNSNTALAFTGDIITLNLVSDETIATPTVTIAGAAATVTNTGANNWKATRTITGAEAGGAIAFNIAFSDITGNAGTPVTATTNNSSVVHDKTAPTLTSVSIASNNANTGFAKAGNTLTISFVSSETITTPNVIIAGAAATVSNTSGNNWTASRTLSGSITEGIIAFTINFSDLNANAGTAVTATTNSSTVVYDATSPVFSSISIASNNPNPSLAKPGNQVTLSFTATETLVTPLVTLAGHTATTTNTGGNNWTAAYTMSATDSWGMVSFTLQAADLAGNQSSTAGSTTNSSSIFFKNEALPIAVTIASNNANTAKAKPGDVVTVSINSPAVVIPAVSIAGHTVSPASAGGFNWTASYTMTATDTEGTIPFVVNYTDDAGNAGNTMNQGLTQDGNTVLFDKTAPSMITVLISSNNANQQLAKTGDQVSVFFTATETLLTPTVTIAGQTATLTGSGGQWTGKYTLTNSDSEGDIPFVISFKDAAGNNGVAVSSTTDNSKVRFDKTNPALVTVSISSNNSNTALALPGNAILLNFTASETVLPVVTIAGHAATSVFNTGGNNWTAAYQMVSSDPTGTVSFSIAFKDVAGNNGATISTTTDNSSVNFQLPTPNSAPVFTAGATQSLAVCSNAAATSINSLLAATDANTGQTLGWSVVSAPAHGSVSGVPAAVSNTGGVITPSTITYTPAAGYSGTDVFVMRVTDGSLSNDITINVNINALPSGSITAAQGSVLCGTNGTLVLTASGGNSYNWFKDGLAITGSSSQITVNQIGVYTATIVSAQGCSSPASGNVTVTRLLAPVAQFSFSTTCINTPVLFTNQSVVNNSGTVSYSWTDNNGHSSSNLSPSFSYSQVGNFDVKLKVIPQACPAIADSITKTINITAATAGIRLPKVNVIENKPAQLEARTQSGASYNWIPTRFLTNAAIQNPQVITSMQQEYQIVMTIPGGCTTVDTLLVQVQAPLATVLVPNVFTPNGDGQNDKLVPSIVASIKTLRFFRVFNRWGKMLYETTQIGQGWDGRYQGQLQPLDTYTWVIEGMDTNGQLVKKQGSVTLLR